MEYGTPVSVWCKGSLKQMGDEVVFCQEGINYDYTYRPACVDPSKFYCYISLQLSSVFFSIICF